MTVRTYKDQFTKDGRLRPTLGVTKAKVKKVQELTEGYLRGNYIAKAQLQEALTTSDAIFNLAYVASLTFVDNYDAIDRSWEEIAGTRTVDDLKPATLYSLNRSWTDGNGATQILDSHGAAPAIPEGTPYPYAYLAGDVTQGAGVTKKGFKTDWTLESRINDGLGALNELPSAMTQVAADTEAGEVWGALTTQKTAASNFLATPIPGRATPVPANAALTRDAIIAAKIQLGNRSINGRRIQVRGGFNLVVPIGQALFANYVLNQSLVTLTQVPTAGAGVVAQGYDYNGQNPLADVTVVESEWVSGTEWYLIPKKGTTVRPVLERLALRGYETPQLFVDNHTGSFVGAASVSPFEGSFDADVITLKLRQFGGGVLWDGGAAVVYSTGAGGS